MSYISYKRLWKLLIDRDLKKGDLKELARLSQTTMAKLAKNKNVNTETLVRVCVVLNCELSDITEIVCDDKNGEKNV